MHGATTKIPKLVVFLTSLYPTLKKRRENESFVKYSTQKKKHSWKSNWIASKMRQILLCYIVRFHHKNFDFTAFPEETDNDRPVDV
jgi:hypothetical protein